MNVVSMAIIPARFIHNDNMARMFTYMTSYVPELFPCLIFYHPKFTANIFDTGKITFSGLKSNGEKRSSFCTLLYYLWKSNPDPACKLEFEELYITSEFPPDITDVPNVPCDMWLDEEEEKENLRFLTNNGPRRMFPTSLVKQTKNKFNKRINKRHATINQDDGTLSTYRHNLIIAKHDQHVRYKIRKQSKTHK